MNTICEAAATTNGLYVDHSDGSLLCIDWISAAFTRKISVADLPTIAHKIDEALALAQQMLELHPDHVNVPEIHTWCLSALRVQQLFEAAKERPTRNPLINAVAARPFQFHLPDTIKGCAVGLARVARGPYSIGKTRGPNIVHGAYFYHEPFHFLTSLAQMAHTGLLTQLERLASVAVRIIQAVARLFGATLPYLNQVHYFRNNETDEEIYEKNAVPMSLANADAQRFSSYWIGHATCLFSVPIRVEEGSYSRVNIITDPIEGDLNTLLYPRMTAPARLLEQCPPIHICLLSHNHQDHLSPEALNKLVQFDPLIVVPTGDGERLRSMGFSRVVELGWLEKIDVQIRDTDGKTYQVGICGVPSNHGSGNYQQSARTSLFNGYVIQSHGLDGDIYFAGDTARLDAEHTEALRDTFAIRYNFQPGGPDEVRSLNISSHQASCDGLAMHLHLMVGKVYRALRAQRGTPPTFEELRAACSRLFTVYMHTKTYKLGNLHFDDTDASVGRVLAWLRTHDSWEELATSDTLKSYEKELLLELAREEGTHLIVGESEQGLTPQQIGELFECTVYVPKIGARFSAPD